MIIPQIKEYMESRGMNNRTMAKLLSVHESQLHRWISGRNKMSPMREEKVQKLINRLIR